MGSSTPKLSGGQKPGVIAALPTFNSLNISVKLGASNHQRGFRHVQFGTALVQLGAARWSGFKVVEEAPPRHKRFGFEMSPDNKFGFWSQHIHLCRHYSRPKGILKHSGQLSGAPDSIPEGPENGCPDKALLSRIYLVAFLYLNMFTPVCLYASAMASIGATWRIDPCVVGALCQDQYTIQFA